MSFHALILFCSTWSLLVPIVIGFPTRKRDLHLIWILVLAGFLADFTVSVLPAYDHRLVILHCFDLVQYPLVVVYFIGQFKKRFSAVTLLSAVLCGFIIYRRLMMDMHEADDIGNTVASLLLILLSFTTLYHIMTTDATVKLYNCAYFFMSIAFLLYGSMTVVLQLIFNSFGDAMSLPEKRFLWDFHNIVNVVQAMLIARGLWLGKEEQKTRNANSAFSIAAL